MKTIEDVAKLKESWRRDPCFDLENEHGFEEYRNELLAYRVKCEAEWEAKKQLQHDKLASMVCPMTFGFAKPSYSEPYQGEELNWGGCLVEKCAWWDTSSEGCAVRMLAALSRTGYSMQP